MTTKIKIDFISDIMCPWCVIGYQRLQQAIDELDVADQIEISWQPFELNPDMPIEGEDLEEHLSRKYGSTIEESKRTAEQITALAKEIGFTIDFYPGMRIVNTRDAHVLLAYAKEHGKQTELKVRLFNAHFNERKDVSDRNVLVNELNQVGLKGDEAIQQLENNEAIKRIKDQTHFWQRQGVSSVPALVFNRTSALPGAQPVEVYKQVLTELLSAKDAGKPRS